MLTVYNQVTNIYYEFENNFSDFINFLILQLFYHYIRRKYSPFRGMSRIPEKSKMGFFMRLVNARKQLNFY